MDDTDHYVTIDYSKDGGRNWSNRRQRSIGKVGQYEQRVRLMRLGTGRTWVLRIRVSSPRKRDLLGAVISIEPTEG